MIPTYVYYAIASGVLAGLASCLAKLGTDSDSPVLMFVCTTFFGNCNDALISQHRLYTVYFYVQLAVRGLFLGLYILVNGVMWAQFSKAMALSSTLRASVVNTAANFLCSAIFAHILFGDALNLGWWIGASFLFSGFVIAVASDSSSSDSSVESSKRK
eukprot:ANDGO_06459.mRNA.1 hypothetical protein ACA1_091360